MRRMTVAGGEKLLHSEKRETQGETGVQSAAIDWRKEDALLVANLHVPLTCPVLLEAVNKMEGRQDKSMEGY